MTSPDDARHQRTARRVVFLPRWHDNPYQELLADGLATLGVRVDVEPGRLALLGTVLAGGRPDVVHIYSPDTYVAYRRSLAAAVVALALWLAQLAVLRVLGVGIVWTAHDLENHERRYPALDRLCRRLTARLAHRVIVHCADAASQATHALHIDPTQVRVVPHGHYRERYPATVDDRASARSTLDLPVDRFVALFLGNLRPHKGLDALLEAHAHLDRDVLLVIAGQPFDEATGASLARRADGRPDVWLRPVFVPDAMVARYLRAADVVVCPFSRSLTSGSLMLALSYGAAVVAPRLGCAAEMMAAEDTLLYDPTDPDALVLALRRAFDARDRLDAIGARHAAHVRGLDWGTIARATLAVYDECIG